jgi:hypothetical protein
MAMENAEPFFAVMAFSFEMIRGTRRLILEI